MHFRCYVEALSWPVQKVSAQIFNVGAANMTVRDLADIIAVQLPPGTQIKVRPVKDARSYRISSDKLLAATGFRPEKKVSDAVRGLLAAFQSGAVDNWHDDRYYNIERMKRLKLK